MFNVMMFNYCLQYLSNYFQPNCSYLILSHLYERERLYRFFFQRTIKLSNFSYNPYTSVHSIGNGLNPLCSSYLSDIMCLCLLQRSSI